MRSPPLVRWLVGILALLLLAALGVVAWLNFGGLRGQIEQHASTALGRQVTLSGPLTWSPAGSHLSLGLRSVRISNPDGFSSPALADIDHLELYLPVDSLWRGEVRVDQVIVDGGTVYLETDPAGDDNWTFADTMDGGAEEPDLAAVPSTIVLEHTNIDYTDGRDQSHHDVDVQHLQLATDLSGSLSIQAQATVDSTPVDLDLGTSSLKKLLSNDTHWPLRGKVQVAETHSEIDLEIQPDSPRWKVSGKIHVADVNMLSALKTDLKLREEAVGAQPLSPAPSAPESESISVGAIQAALKMLDVDLLITSERARIAGYEVHDLELHSQIEDGALRLDAHLPVESGTADAHFELQPLRDELRTRLRADAKGMRIEVLYQAEDVSVEVKDLALRMETSGATADQMLAKLSVNLTANGLSAGRATAEPAEPRQRIDRVEVRTDPKETRLVATGVYNAEHYTLELHSAGLPTLRTDQDSLPLNAKLEAAGARLVLDGTLHHPLSRPSLDAKSSLEGKDMNALGKLLGLPLPKLAQYRIEGQLALAPTEAGGVDAQLDKLKARLDQTNIQGNLQLLAIESAKGAGQAGDTAARFNLKGRLQASTLQLDEWMDAFADTPGAKPTKGGSGADLPRDLDIDLKLEATRLTGGAVELSRLSTRLTLHGGLFALDPFRIRLGDTPLNGKLRLDQRKRIPSLRFSLDSKELHNEQGGGLVAEGALRFRASAVHISGDSTGRNLEEWQRNLVLKGQVERLRLSIETDPATPPRVLRLTKLDFVRSKTAPIRLSANGVYDQTPFTLSAASQSVRATAADKAKHQAVDITLQAKDLSITLKSPATWPLDPQRLDLPFTLQAERLPAAWRTSLFEHGPYLLSGRLLRDPKGFRLEELRARVGDSDLEGSLTLQTTTGRNKLIARLESDLLDLSTLATVPAGSSSSTGMTRPAVSDLMLPDAPIIPPLPRDWDADIHYHAKQIHFAQFQVMDAETYAKWRGGRLTVSPLRLRTSSGGTARAEVTMDLHRTPPAIALKTHIENLDLGWIWVEDSRGQKTKWITSINANLRGQGNTLHAFLSSANGTVGLDAGSLTVDLRMLRLWTTRLFGLMMKGFNTQQDTEGDILCIVGDATVENGVMHSDSFLFDVGDASIFGRGTLRLADERIDLRLVPKLKNRSVFNTAIPVDVRGTLSHPSFLPAPEGAVLAAGKTYLSVINPLFLLGNYALSGNRDKTPCATFRMEMRAQEKGGTHHSGQQQRTPGGFMQDFTEDMHDLVP